jgi:hypothetical protein
MRRSGAAAVAAWAALALLVAIATGWLAVAPAAHAQAATTAVQVELNEARAEFGAEIRFQLRARGEEPVRSVLLLYQVDDSPVQNTATPTVTSGDTLVSAAYIWRVANVLVPGTEVKYQWQLETASGKTSTTKEQSVAYVDSRFGWREGQAAGERLTVYFQPADPQSGQVVLDEARRVLQRLRSEYGLSLDKPLRVYAYTRQQDYVSALVALRPTEAAVTAGVDRVYVLAPAGTANMTAAMQQLRREVANAVFLQKTENPYAQPPRWLADGFGRYISGEEISPQNYQALGELAQANRLLPLRTLNGNYPTNERDLTLAYFESLSVVKYISDSYGPEKLRALFAAIKDGNTADDALRKGLGVSLDQLESRWKNALKSGAAARPASGQRGGQEGAPLGDGIVDRVFGPAIQYWQGSLGQFAKPVVLGGAGFIVVGVVAIVGSIVVSTIRRARMEEY